MISTLDAKREKRIRFAKREKARRNILDFTKYTFKQYKHESWHHGLIADHYQKAICKSLKRLMIFLPPRHMKTEMLERSVAWAFGKDPDLKVISCAYGVSRSVKSGKNVKQLIKDKKFSDVFTDYKSEKYFDSSTTDTQAYWEIGNGHRGSYLSAGVGSGVTGEGMTLGLVDDPVKSRAEAESPTYQEATKDWYFGTFLNRQNEKDSVIIIINTRWNRKDLSGSILDKEGILTYNGHKPKDGCPDWNGSPDGKWTVLCLPAEMDEEAYEWKHPEDPRGIGDALWPDRFPVSFLEQFKAIKYDWVSLYQGRPTPKGGNIINRAWFKEPVLDFPRGGKLIRFWDLASTPKEESKKNNPDFTAGALLTYVGGIVYIIDLVATQIATKTKYDLMKQTAVMDDEMYGSVMQVWEEEGGASGKDTTVTLNELLDAHLRGPLRVRKNKNFYIELLANKAETGNVRVVKGPWLYKKHDGNTFFDSAEAFPSSTSHDDDIDAVSKACFLLTGGSMKNIDGAQPDEEEHRPEEQNPEAEEQNLFQTYENQILKNNKIDESTITDFQETLYNLDQIALKYVNLGDDKKADLVYDEYDRIEKLSKETKLDDTEKVLPHYFDKDKAPECDINLNMAIGQGYVPEGCLLGGHVVMGLINKGDNPCKGCGCDKKKCGGQYLNETK